MKQSLLWKLLGINFFIIVFVIGIVWLAVDFLSAQYFVTLMKKYNISPVSSHQMFVDSVHTYLIWATVAAVVLAVTLSFILTRRVLGPLTQMADITVRIAEGDYSSRVPMRSHDEVGRLAEAFNSMAESLKTIENLRKDLMINVAHELRTPLTNIQGYLEALLDEVVPSSRETYEVLLEETLRLADLVENILRLARADAARVDLSKEDVDLGEMIDHVLEAFKTRFQAKQITVKSNYENEIVVRADSRKLLQVIDNLIENAVQYADRGGTFRVFIQRTDRAIKVLFANTGGNLSEQDLPFIFERFYRGEKSRSREHGGAGIGLAIVKELIEAHNGSVGAELADRETVLWFSLPA
jgi:two-component system sensor histidine kinase BaeS